MLTSLIIILSLADYCQCFLLLTEVIGGTRLELFQLEPIPRKYWIWKFPRKFIRGSFGAYLGKYFVGEITLVVTFLDSLVTFRNVMRPSVKFVTFPTQKCLVRHIFSHCTFVTLSRDILINSNYNFISTFISQIKDSSFSD